MARRTIPGESPLLWLGSSKRDLLSFPEPVKDEIGRIGCGSVRQEASQGEAMEG